MATDLISISVGTVRQAVRLYVEAAYPGGLPPAVQGRLVCLDNLADDAPAPETCFEVAQVEGRKSFALRLGQPLYPHMKLVIEQGPGGGYLFRADAHDAMLHAPPGSPDAAPLAALRASNKALTEKIEAAWVAAGLPTFREYLRQALERKRKG